MGLLPSRPFVVLGVCYLAGILLFALFRTAFLIVFRESLVNVSVTQLATSFAYGWRFDQIVVLFVLLPLALMMSLVGLKNRSTRILVVTYLTVVFSFTAILLLADLRFFKYFQNHLNFQAVTYFTEGGNTTWHLIETEPMFAVNLVLWLGITIVLPFVWLRIVRTTRTIPERRNWTGQIAWLVIFLALTLLGVRGRLSLSPIDWGAAYFSENHVLNQSALNGIYTLGRAFTEEGRDPRVSYLHESERFPFVPFQDGLDSVRAMLGTTQDVWLEPDKSLLRTTKQPTSRFGFQPNIVLVLMESWSGRFTGSLGAPNQLTPHFDSLAERGILFTNFYASGVRTSYGMTAVLGSFPSLPGRSIMTRYNAGHPFVALSEILRARDYTNLFVHGGDLVFDNMRGFLTMKGYDRFYGDNELGNEFVFAKWGIPDEVVFRKSIPIADSVRRPFQMTLLTISNHEPFDLPDSSIRRFFDGSSKSRIQNAIVYADCALGSFMKEFQSQPVFDSTIFVFVSDHTLWGYGKFHPDPIDYQIPLLIYSPALLGDTGMIVSTVGGQVDVVPTLMGFLGSDYTHASWGRDLCRDGQSDNGYAIVNYSVFLGIARDSVYYSERLGGKQLLYQFADSGLVLNDVKSLFPDQFAAMQRRLRAYVQIADQLSTPANGSDR